MEYHFKPRKKKHFPTNVPSEETKDLPQNKTLKKWLHTYDVETTWCLFHLLLLFLNISVQLWKHLNASTFWIPLATLPLAWLAPPLPRTAT
jgi:hypothetical protein